LGEAAGEVDGVDINSVRGYSFPLLRSRTIMTNEQLHTELIAELRLQGSVEQADAFEAFGAKESEHFLAGVGMTLSKAVEKLRIRTVLI